jgi:hypothetical protein
MHIEQLNQYHKKQNSEKLNLCQTQWSGSADNGTGQFCDVR